MAINKSSFGQRRPFAVTMAAIVFLSLVKTVITPEVMSGGALLCFAGHLLILVGAMSLLPLSLRQALLVGVTVQLCYVLPLAVMGRNPEPAAFLLQNGYMLSVWFVLGLKCHINHRTRRREFNLRCKLHAMGKAARVYSAGESVPALASAKEY